jgi:hypothetical protein
VGGQGIGHERTAIAFLVAISSSPAWAVFNDGNMLLSFCEDAQDSFGYGHCYGYVSGIADAMDNDNVVVGYRAFIDKGIIRPALTSRAKPTWDFLTIRRPPFPHIGGGEDTGASCLPTESRAGRSRLNNMLSQWLEQETRARA